MGHIVNCFIRDLLEIKIFIISHGEEFAAASATDSFSLFFHEADFTAEVPCHKFPLSPFGREGVGE